jgi:signal transduction histidine kinase
LWKLFPALADPESNAWRELHAAMDEKRPVQFEQMHAPGELWTSVAAYPTGEGGLALFLRDISERRKSEQFQERLIGIVGHDLRNPLQAILMSARVLMQRGELSDRAVPGLLRIQRSADRMTQIINDLLDFTRARVGGGIPLTPTPTDLCPLAKGIVEELEVTHPGQLRMECTGDVEGEWDPSRLGQVVSNLLSNALTYGDGREPVRLEIAGRGDEVQLSVCNRGQPIPPEVLPHIFDPFRRASGERQGGLGLGLYIVEQIVLAHRGSISVQSDDQATAFTVRLPRRPAT